MKNAIGALFCAVVLLVAAGSAWAEQECYTLAGGTFFWGEGNMGLVLNISDPSGEGKVLKVTGKGINATNDPIYFQGATRTFGLIKEFSLHGSGMHIYTSIWGQHAYLVNVIYEYHLALAPKDGRWEGTYHGEIHTSEGEEKDVSGVVVSATCK